MMFGGHNGGGTASPTLLPASSEAAEAAAAMREFPGGDRAAAILVVTRGDGAALTDADLAAVAQAHARMQVVPQTLPGRPAPALVSGDGKAAIATTQLSSALSGFELRDAVQALRSGVADGLPGALIAHVTGGPAFGADIANAFSGANVTLLVVTALV